MNIQFERNGQSIWCVLPLSYEGRFEILKRFGALDLLDTKVRLTALDYGYEALYPLVGKTHDLEHLNLLARYMDGFCGTEFDQYMAAVRYTGVTELKDFINLTQNIANYTLVKPNDSLKTIGLNHYIDMNGSYKPRDSKEDDELNLAAIGQALLATGKGVKTQYGLVFENGKELWEPFNGTNIPCYYDRDFVFNCRLTYNGVEEYLFLPCHEVTIAKAVHRLGANDISECNPQIEDNTSSFSEGLMDLVNSPDEPDLYELNRLAHATETFDEADANKLCSLWRYVAEKEVVSVIPTLASLAEHMGSFQYAPNVKNAEELGEYLIKDSNEYSFDPALEDYYDYERFGEDIMAEQDGMFFDFGYVGVSDDVQLWEILEPNDEQQMGEMQ